MAPPPHRERRFSWSLAFTLIFLIAAALLALVFLRLESWPMRTGQQSAAELERIAREVRDAFISIAQLQPQVRINERVYLEQTTPIAELAVLTRQVQVEHEFSHTWAGSTKRVKLHGTFLVRAGFDLHAPVSADVRSDAITAEFPHAQILGVEQKQVEVLEMENGYWNRVSSADLESELATLPKLAREKAAQSGLPAAAEEALQKQLEQRLGNSRPLRILFTPAPTAKP